MNPQFSIAVCSFAEFDPLVLYRILRLRSAVFAVEQNCVYNDLDGRDHEPDAWHVYASDATGEVISALRLLVEPDGNWHLGRVVTAVEHRGSGVAGALIDRALELVPPGTEVHLNAQARLEPWYERWRFTRSGPDLLIDDIVHVPMTRPAR